MQIMIQSIGGDEIFITRTAEESKSNTSRMHSRIKYVCQKMDEKKGLVNKKKDMLLVIANPH